MTNILGSDRFVQTVPIDKGWSGDRKYCATDKAGKKYLLRIAPIERYDRWKALFDILEQVTALGIPICRPVELGLCENDSVYAPYSWVDGEDLRELLLSLPKKEQYGLGFKAGEFLKAMHTIPAPASQEDWGSRFNRKADNKLRQYHECGLRFEGDTHVIEYIERNRCLLANRPQCFQHGDYHDGNIMISDGKLNIIDFGSYDFGDTWEEFNRIMLCAVNAPNFAVGRIHGYFGGNIPYEFFRLLAFYIAVNTVSGVTWIAPNYQHGMLLKSAVPSDFNFIMNLAKNVLVWFDDMKNPVPTWFFDL